MDFIEKWGKDEEEAIKLALDELKLDRDEVNIVVLEESSKGFLGIGAKLAKVRVEKKEAAPVMEKIVEKVSEKAAEAVEVGEKFISSKVRKDEKPAKKSKNKENRKSYGMDIPDDLVEVVESPALDFLREVSDKMGIDVEISAKENENSMYISITGKDTGTVIGKRGQTLDALQYLTRLVANKNEEKYKRVVIDAEDYRAKREKTLENLARRLADKVIRSKRSMKLEPMNPYERKVIHATLQGNSKVVTRSEGEEPYRRIVIEIK